MLSVGRMSQSLNVLISPESCRSVQITVLPYPIMSDWWENKMKIAMSFMMWTWGKKKPVISTTSHWLHRWSYVEWGRGLYLYVDTSQKGWLEVILGGSHYSYIPQKQPAQENLPLYFCVWRGFALLNPGAKSGWLNHLDRLAQLFNFIFFFFCGNASYTSDLGFIE